MQQLNRSPLSTIALSAVESVSKLCYRGIDYQLPQSMTHHSAQDLAQADDEQVFQPQKLCYRGAYYTLKVFPALPYRVNFSQRLTYRGVSY